MAWSLQHSITDVYQYLGRKWHRILVLATAIVRQALYCLVDGTSATFVNKI